jgi:hypothetical protein
MYIKFGVISGVSKTRFDLSADINETHNVCDAELSVMI